jgi:hypothetical protein
MCKMYFFKVQIEKRNFQNSKKKQNFQNSRTKNELHAKFREKNNSPPLILL